MTGKKKSTVPQPGESAETPDPSGEMDSAGKLSSTADAAEVKKPPRELPVESDTTEQGVPDPERDADARHGRTRRNADSALDPIEPDQDPFTTRNPGPGF